MLRWLPPRRAQIVVHGDEAGDFAFASSSFFLVSERVQAAIEESGLTGISDFEEVEITSTIRKAGVVPRRYFHVEIARWAADVDESKSGIERPNPSACRVCLGAGVDAIRGFTIDPTTWTGADIFVARALPGVVVTSDAFRQTVEKHRLSNVELVPTQLFTWDPRAKTSSVTL